MSSHHITPPATSFLYLLKSISSELGFPFQAHLFPRVISLSLLQPPIPVFRGKSKRLRYQNNRCHKDSSSLCCVLLCDLISGYDQQGHSTARTGKQVTSNVPREVSQGGAGKTPPLRASSWGIKVLRISGAAGNSVSTYSSIMCTKRSTWELVFTALITAGCILPWNL